MSYIIFCCDTKFLKVSTSVLKRRCESVLLYQEEQRRTYVLLWWHNLWTHMIYWEIITENFNSRKLGQYSSFKWWFLLNSNLFEDQSTLISSNELKDLQNKLLLPSLWTLAALWANMQKELLDHRPSYHHLRSSPFFVPLKDKEKQA